MDMLSLETVQAQMCIFQGQIIRTFSVNETSTEDLENELLKAVEKLKSFATGSVVDEKQN